MWASSEACQTWITDTEYASYFRPRDLAGIEALHARFVDHACRRIRIRRGRSRWWRAASPGPAWMRPSKRATRGELLVLEPDAVHTGMAAVPEGWAYKVLYVEPGILHEWVFHNALASEPPGLGIDEAAVLARAHLGRRRAVVYVSRPSWTIVAPGGRRLRR